MINARFDALQDRLLPDKHLRPPLGVRAGRSNAEAEAPKAGIPPTKKAQKANPGKEAKERDRVTAPAPSETNALNKGEAWTTVLGRKAKKKAQKATKMAASTGLAPKAKEAMPPSRQENIKTCPQGGGKVGYASL